MIHIFYSFHYSHDYDRIRRVLDAYHIQGGYSCTPFISDEEIERMKQEGLDSIHRWIETEIAKADAVVVLIGEHSFGRYFIEYEIQTAYALNKPLMGVFINEIPDKNGRVGLRSKTPLVKNEITYDWILDNGALNIHGWINKLLADS